jgi:5-carboxymethyl-2-hydroxymuconate isomerase
LFEAAGGSMPHFILEYSENLTEVASPANLLKQVHALAIASGLFEVSAIRVRGERRDLYIIADGDPNYIFVHLTVRMQKGRDEQTKRKLGEELLASITSYFKENNVTRPFAINVEVQEVPDLMFRHRTIGRS